MKRLITVLLLVISPVNAEDYEFTAEELKACGTDRLCLDSTEIVARRESIENSLIIMDENLLAMEELDTILAEQAVQMYQFTRKRFYKNYSRLDELSNDYEFVLDDLRVYRALIQEKNLHFRLLLPHIRR